jgi:protein tyrosine phosphatase
MKIDKRKHTPDVCPPEVRGTKYHRHADILPNPKTRVMLPLINGDVGSGYVNSNFVRGADGNPKAFIATMGPKKAYLETFWRMIWLQNAEVIIMVTGLIEGGKDKCAPYFPQTDNPNDSGNVLQCGMFTIKNLGIKQFGKFQKSTMELTMGKEKHMISHWWFTAWPDHGVPTLPTPPGAPKQFDVDSMLDLIQEIQKDRTPNTGKVPQVVHCSAGVGRTGVTISVQHAMHMLQTTNKVELLTIIDTIRQDRCLLVQHAEQYEYLHMAVRRWCDRVGHEHYVGKKPKEKKTEPGPDLALEASKRKQEKQLATAMFDDVWV